MQCPVCSYTTKDGSSHSFCRALAAYFGYSKDEMEELMKLGSSLMVPFHESRKIIFFYDFFSRATLNKALIQAAVETRDDLEHWQHTHFLKTKLFKSDNFPDITKVFIKEDPSKDMVLYQEEGDIEHFGSEEREALFSWLGREILGLQDFIIPAAICISNEGKKLSITPYLDRDKWKHIAELNNKLPNQVIEQGILLKLAVMDFITGQIDRNIENIFFNKDAQGADLPSDQLVKLIDNDFGFSSNNIPITTLSYLNTLKETVDLNELTFDSVADWFSQISLYDVIQTVLPFALPIQVVVALIERFLIVSRVISKKKSVQYFMDKCFYDEDSSIHKVSKKPIIDLKKAYGFRRMVLEGQHGKYVALLWTNINKKFTVTVLSGDLFDYGNEKISQVDCKKRMNGMALFNSYYHKYQDQGYVELIKRRFYIDMDQDIKVHDIKVRAKGTVKIVELRRDDQVYVVVEKEGPLGHYVDKKRIGVYTSSSIDEANNKFQEIEERYLESDFKSIKEVLSSFKEVPVIF